jgi:hypothetical protein
MIVTAEEVAKRMMAVNGMMSEDFQIKASEGFWKEAGKASANSFKALPSQVESLDDLTDAEIASVSMACLYEMRKTYSVREG